MDFVNLVLLYTQLVLVQADIYSILGLKNTANLMEIKQAYHKLVLQYHPDRNAKDDATEKFIEITKAYNILMENHGSFNCFFKHCKKEARETASEGTNRSKIKERHEDLEELYEDILRDSNGFNVYMDDVQQMSAEDLFNL